MNFSDALAKLKHGRYIYRSDWVGVFVYIKIQKPDALSKMTLPYIFIKTVCGDLVPWVANQIDLLAEDWEELVLLHHPE